jgi:small-conductance mechanosensitive channel
VENAVFGAFPAHGIEIPLPQRDLHARSWSPEQPSSPSMLTAKE